MRHVVYILTSLFLMAPNTYSWAQEFTDYVPTGFHAPFLRQGEYILAGDLQHRDNKNTGFNTSLTSIDLNGYLGFTDRLTMSSQMKLVPNHTLGAGDKNKFYVHPTVTFAYRLSRDFEFFSTSTYQSYQNIGADRISTITVLVGRNPDGTDRFETHTNVQSGFNREFRTVSIRAGFVWRGNL
jgi:hypothetical protein